MRKEWKRTPKSQSYIAGLPPAACTKEATGTYSKTGGSAPSAASQRPSCTDETLKHRSSVSCTPFPSG